MYFLDFLLYAFVFYKNAVILYKYYFVACFFKTTYRDIICILYNSPFYLFFCFCFNKFVYFVYLFLAVFGLRCCTRAFSSCGEWGLLFVVVRGLLIAVASLVVEHGLWAHRLQ